MRKKQLKILCSLAVFVYVIGASMVQGSERDSLTGITAMRVLVEDFSPEAQAIGLNSDVFKTAAELRLRRSGITVSDGATLPYLYINVTCTILESGSVAFAIEVSFRQPVIVKANQEDMFAETWSVGGSGSVGIKNAHRIRASVDDKVDAFINDYLAANPRQVAPPVNYLINNPFQVLKPAGGQAD